MPIQINVIHQRGDLCALADAKMRLDHATEHDGQVVCPSGPGKRDRAPDTTGLRKLDINAISHRGDQRHVVSLNAALVEHDRQSLGQFAVLVIRVVIATRKRLLDELHTEPEQIGRDRLRNLDVPTLVAIDPNRAGKASTDGLEPLEI